MTFCNEANFTCACLLVVNEVFRSRSDIRYSVFQNLTVKSEPEAKPLISSKPDADSDEEVFQDLDRIEEAKQSEIRAVNQEITNKLKNTPYDAMKREPKFASAEGQPIFELVQLSRHCHPTVSMWAQDLLRGDLLEYGGDPLLDFGLSNFLDRISFKQPKTDDKIKRDRQRMSAFEKPMN